MTDNYGISRVALLTDGVHPLVLGGMQKHSYFLLTNLLARGVNVLLYHPSSSKELKPHLPEHADGLLEEQRFPLDTSRGLPGSYLKKSFAYSHRIAEHLREQQDVDFIYAQGFAGWAMADLKKKGVDLPPMGVNFHGLEMYQQAAGLKQRIIQVMFKGPVKFNLSHAERAYSLGGKLNGVLRELIPASQISEIPIALDKDWLRKGAKPFDSEKTKVLFIGRYERRKGIEELHEHISQTSLADVEYHFIGPIPASKRLKDRRVTYHGKVMDKAKLLMIIDDCHILVVPSYAEGMPTVILEAMSRGLLVLATDVGAVAAVVNDETGVCIPSGDVSAIGVGLGQLIARSTSDKQAMSQAAISRIADTHLWPRIIDITLKDMAALRSQKAC